MKISRKQLDFLIKNSKRAASAGKRVGSIAVARSKADPVAAGVGVGAVVGGVGAFSNSGREEFHKAHGAKRVRRTLGGTLSGAWMGGAATALLKGRPRLR